MRVSVFWFQLAFLLSAQDEKIFAYRPACGKSSQITLHFFTFLSTLIPKSYAMPNTKPFKIKKEVTSTDKPFFGSIKRILSNKAENSSSKLLNSKDRKLFSRRVNKVFGKLFQHEYRALKTEMKTVNKNEKKIYPREIRRCDWFLWYYNPVVRIPSRCIYIFNHIFPIAYVKPNTAYSISRESEKCTTKSEKETIGTNEIISTTTEKSSTLEVPLTEIVRCEPLILETELRKEPELSQIENSKCPLKPNFQKSDLNCWDNDQSSEESAYPE